MNIFIATMEGTDYEKADIIAASYDQKILRAHVEKLYPNVEWLDDTEALVGDEQMRIDIQVVNMLPQKEGG